MSDFDFESRLERMFAQPPAVSDTRRFAARVEERLDRSGRFRNVLITSAGVGGGVVAASQAFGSGVLARLGDLQMPMPSPVTGESLAALAAGGEVVWMAAAMLALTVGFLATRFADVF